MREVKNKKISCIWMQIIQYPRDIISQREFPLGSRFILNKKKFPYLFKYGYLWFKTRGGIAKLYEDEIVIVVEKYEHQNQKDIKYVVYDYGDKFKGGYKTMMRKRRLAKLKEQNSQSI